MMKILKRAPSLNLKKNIKRSRPVVILNEFVSAIIGAIAAVWKTVVVTVAGYAITVGTIVKAILIVGAAAYSYSQSQKAKKTGLARDLRASGHLINTRSTSEPIPIVYGTCRIGGNIVYMNCTGDQNKYLHMIITFSEGPVWGINTDGQGAKIWLDDRRIQEFGSYAYWEFFTGTSDQQVCQTLKNADPNWDDAMRWTAYLYLRLEYNDEKFAALPNVTAEIKGRLILDTRDSQVKFSDNNALVAYDFLRNDRYSIGLPQSVFDLDEINYAANWCDANSYRFNGPIMDRQSLLDNFEEILKNFRAGLVWSEGEYKLLIYKYDTPVMTLTEDDIEADSFNIIVPGIPETPNRVIVTYIDAVDNYVSKTRVIEDIDAVLSYDGEERDFELDLKGTTNALQATKLGSYYIDRNRLNYQFSFACHPKTLALEPMDMIQITHSLPGWTNKVVRVLDWESMQDGRVRLLCLNEASSLYDDDVNVASHNAYETNLPDPLSPPPDVTNLLVQDTEDLTGVKISYNRPGLHTNWSHCEIFISRDNQVTWELIASSFTDNILIYRDVIAGNTYYFKVVSYSHHGVPSQSPPVYGITVAGTTCLAPANLTASAAFQNIMLNWTNPEDPNVYFIEIWSSTTNNRANAIKVGEAYSDMFTHYVGVYGATRYYWIRAKNKNGGYSPWHPSNQYGGVSATTAQVSTADLLDSAVVSAKLAESAVITSKLANLSVDNSKLADLAVDAAKLANSSVGTSKLVDLAVTSDKLAASAVTTSKLANLSVDNTKLANLAVDAAKLADSAVTSTKIANAAVGSAAIAALAVGTAHIQDGAIQTAKIGDLQVTAAKIGSGAITSAKIQDAAVGSAAIAALAVGTAHIQDGAIQTAKIGNLQVTEAKIASGAITSAKIQDAAIVNAKIQNLAVDNAKIANLAVSTSKIADYNVTRMAYYSNDANVTVGLTEVEIGSISINAALDTDAIWVQARCLLSQNPYGSGKDGCIIPKAIIFRLRAETLSGTILDQVTINPGKQYYGYTYYGELYYPPILLMCIKGNAGAGTRTYKFSAIIKDNDPTVCQNAIVSARRMLAIARSK